MNLPDKTRDFFEELKKGHDFEKEYKDSVVERIYDKSKVSFYHTNAQSFIGWIGGKSKTAKEISAMCQKLKHKIFGEVFVGSGAIFFTKRLADEGSFVNDVNGNLINLYDQIRSNLNELMYFIFNTVKSKEKFNEWRTLYNSTEWIKIPAMERAAIYFYLMKYTFSGDEASMHYAHNFKGITYEVYMQLIRCSEKLQGVEILNMDFELVIEKYNKRKNVLFFLDPPYWVANTGVYYKHVFSEKQHIKLSEMCKEISKTGNSFLLTYDNVPQIRALYEGYNIFEMVYNYSAQAGENQKATEIVITNSVMSKQGELSFG